MLYGPDVSVNTELKCILGYCVSAVATLATSTQYQYYIEGETYIGWTCVVSWSNDARYLHRLHLVIESMSK